jgi:hypothetical protein
MVKSSKDRNISLISEMGEVSSSSKFYINFNYPVEFHDPYNSSNKMNLIDLFNPKYIDIYVKPANDRHLDPESRFNISDLNFTWSPLEFNGKRMNFDANFSNLRALSPLLE